MFISDFFPTFITLADGNHHQKQQIDGIDMTSMLFEGKPSPRNEIIYDVAGSVRVPTVRAGDFKLMGDALYNVVLDPSEQSDIASQHPGIVKKLRTRLDAVGKERPPLGEKPLLMDPPLPYVYGLNEQKPVPAWLVKAVEEIRATQPKAWAPGETPWPKAPVGANASKMDGLKDETGDRN
jgi:hypothetical protein